MPKRARRRGPARPVRKRTQTRSKSSRRPSPKFVGREASPVLDRYPPRASGPAIRGPPPLPTAPAPLPSPRPAARPPEPPAPPPGAAAPAPPPPAALIRLEQPFDMDRFAQQLGESAIRITVPRENLAELLERVAQFMGFGIYVYAFSVRPSAHEVLKSFEVELRRVDFSPAAKEWLPFVERGRTDSPFGPGGDAGRRA